MDRREALVRGLLEHPKPSELEVVQIPEVVRLKDVPQDPKNHPEGSAYIHTMEVIDRAANIKKMLPYEVDQITLMLGALLHDVGKFENTFYRGDSARHLTHWTKKRPENTRIVSYGHDVAGAKLVPTILEENIPKILFGLIPRIEKLVAFHMRPLLLQNAKLKSFRKVANNGGELELIGYLCWADKGVRPDYWFNRIKELLNEETIRTGI